jgi:hypothetical protein
MLKTIRKWLGKETPDDIWDDFCLKALEEDKVEHDGLFTASINGVRVWLGVYPSSSYCQPWNNKGDRYSEDGLKLSKSTKKAIRKRLVEKFIEQHIIK